MRDPQKAEVLLEGAQLGGGRVVAPRLVDGHVEPGRAEIVREHEQLAVEMIQHCKRGTTEYMSLQGEKEEKKRRFNFVSWTAVFHLGSVQQSRGTHSCQL